MILEQWTNKRTGVSYRRITKGNAKKLFADGYTLIIAPVYANMDSPWHLWAIIQYNDIDGQSPWASFDRIVKSFTYYNCIGEFGRYPKYYIPETIYHSYFGRVR